MLTQIDMKKSAINLIESDGIVFIDEIDKVAQSQVAAGDTG